MILGIGRKAPIAARFIGIGPEVGETFIPIPRSGLPKRPKNGGLGQTPQSSGNSRGADGWIVLGGESLDAASGRLELLQPVLEMLEALHDRPG